MNLSKVLFIVISISIFGSGLALAENLYPIDDIYIDTIFTGQHDEGHLYIANEPNEPHINQVMMKFDLSAYDGRYIDEALLWVYRWYGCSHGNTHAMVYEITEDWNEDTWPLDQYVSHGETMWSEGILGNMGWNILDVSYLVNSWTLGEMENRGMVLVGQDGTRMSKLYSSEAGNGYEPYLQMPTLISVNETDALPEGVGVTSYPNPFNARVNINYSLTESADIKLDIFNILGQHVETLVKQSQSAGNYSVTWNASSNPTGIYFYKLSVGDNSITKKMVYLK